VTGAAPMGSRCRGPPILEADHHSWPGGPQYLPARFIGPVARNLDATGILLQMARDVLL